MSPTVLIFLKAPIPGKAKTRLAAGVGDDAAIEIYGKLVRRQMAAIPDDWSVEVHFAPAGEQELVQNWVGEEANRKFFAQMKTGLGQRLVHAGKGAFARGAEAVVFVGGDCVELTTDVFREAQRQLSTRSAVLGPTEDGGYYLLGLSEMTEAVFAGIDWGTESVSRQTRERLQTAGLDWSELPVLRDVDTAEDWAALSDRFDGG